MTSSRLREMISVHFSRYLKRHSFQSTSRRNLEVIVDVKFIEILQISKSIPTVYRKSIENLPKIHDLAHP